MSIIVDGSKPLKSSILEVGLSTKSARSQEKFTEASTITDVSETYLPDAERFGLRRAGDSSGQVFLYPFAHQA